MVNKSFQYQNNRKNTDNVDELSIVGMRKVRGGVKKYFRVIHISSTNSSVNVYYLWVTHSTNILEIKIFVVLRVGTMSFATSLGYQKKNRPKKIITLITVFCYYKLHCFCRLKQSLNIELNFSYSKLKDQLTFLLK